jgi:hypothetical protein
MFPGEKDGAPRDHSAKLDRAAYPCTRSERMDHRNRVFGITNVRYDATHQLTAALESRANARPGTLWDSSEMALRDIA